MSKSYGQYCPLSLAMELLGERWTMLVVSRLIDGCRRFNEIHRGVPKMSASLLSTRLAQLEHAGLCIKQPAPNGHGSIYEPTEACWALDGIIMNLAAWGQKWARDMETDDLDPAFLAWSMSTRLDADAMPAGRTTVLAFEFTGTTRGHDRFWLMKHKGRIEMCMKNPGYESDVTIRADIRHFIHAWRGFRSLRDEIAAGRIRVEGPPGLVRQVPKWLLGSALAPVPRCAPGAEAAVFAKTQRMQAAE